MLMHHAYAYGKVVVVMSKNGSWYLFPLNFLKSFVTVAWPSPLLICWQQVVERGEELMTSWGLILNSSLGDPRRSTTPGGCEAWMSSTLLQLFCDICTPCTLMHCPRYSTDSWKNEQFSFFRCTPWSCRCFKTATKFLKCSASVFPDTNICHQCNTVPAWGMPCKIASTVRWNTAGADATPKDDRCTEINPCGCWELPISVIPLPVTVADTLLTNPAWWTLC